MSCCNHIVAALLPIPTLSTLFTKLLSLPFFACHFFTTAVPTATGEISYFSLFFSSRQMHSAAISARSTPGATCTPYVCWPKNRSLPLRILRSMRATTAPVLR